LKSALEVLAGLHEVLDVVHVGEVELQNLEEVALRLRQVLVRQEIQLKKRKQENKYQFQILQKTRLLVALSFNDKNPSQF
jgi:hypothetical protein